MSNRNISDFRFMANRWLPGGVWAIFMVLTVAAVGQNELNVDRPDSNFPDGISPSHVYARIDLLDRSLDQVLESLDVKLQPKDFPQEIESDLKPMHVYQAVSTCTWRLQELDEQVGVRQIPIISARPRVYHPRDVLFVVDMMLNNVREIGNKLNIAELPTDEPPLGNKTATDVFNLAVKIFIKLNALCRYEDLTPSEVYSQMVRATEDVKSMLRQSDPACRYFIDVQAPNPDNPDDAKTPADMFLLCLEIRQLINEKRTEIGLETIPVPTAPSQQTIRPREVFFQTQIIIAELNLLKKPLHTISSTPLAIPVTDKNPTHVYGQGVMVKYLLEQVKTK